MKHSFTVYTDSGLPDSFTSAVQVAFTLTPSTPGSGMRSHNSVVCKTMTFNAQGAPPGLTPKSDSKNLKTSSFGVEQEATWEWETTFAFSKYEPINGKQRRLVGELWPTSPGEYRTIGPRNVQQRSSTELYYESVSLSQMATGDAEEEWSTSGSSHAERSAELTGKSRIRNNRRDEEWSRPQSYYALDPLHLASVVAINNSGTSQNVALYVRNPTDQLFDTVAVYDSVQDSEEIIASSSLLLQAYVVDEGVCNYDLLGKDLGSPIFDQPLECDSLSSFSKWRLCKGKGQEIRLVRDGADLDLWSMKKLLDALFATVCNMKTTDVTAIKDSLSTTEARISLLDQKLTVVSEYNSRKLQEQIKTTSEHFTRLDNDVSLVQGMVDKLERTMNEQDAKLDHLPIIAKRIHDTQEELAVTQRSVEGTRSEVQATKVKVEAMETQRNRADQELSILEGSLNNTRNQVNVIQRELNETQAGLHDMIEHAFQDSKAIQVIMDSKIEQQYTTIINSSLASGVESRLSTIETKTGRLENQLVSIIARPEVTGIPQGLEETVRTVNAKVGKTESALWELQQSIPRTILETLSNQRVREDLATAVRDSVVIQEFKDRMDQRSRAAALVLASDVEPRLMAVEQMFDIMEPRLSVVETKIEGSKDALPPGVEARLLVVEGKIVGISESSSNTQQHFSQLQETVSGMGTSFETSKNNLAELHDAVENVANKLGVACREVDILKDLSNLTNNTRLSALETTVGSISTRVVGVTSQIGGLVEAFNDQLVTSIASARKHTEELSTKLSGRVAPLEDLRLQEFVPSSERRLDLVKSHLDSTADRLGKVEVSVGDIQYTITSHTRTKVEKSQVDLLEQGLGQIKKEVARLTESKASWETTLESSIAAEEQPRSRLATVQSQLAKVEGGTKLTHDVPPGTR